MFRSNPSHPQRSSLYVYCCQFYKLLLPVDGQDWPEYLGRIINRVLFIVYYIVFYVDCILMDATCDSWYSSHQLAAVRHG